MGAIDINSMSVEERLALLDRIWDSLSDQPAMNTLSAAQREELDRRIDDFERNGSTGQPIETVLREIESGSE
ncbi:MAG: hypothetical protein EXQ47_08825 [Bryobacterales bacterium]|nr:hypothetical protein [Bryobacterales bacterium]